MQSTTAPTKLGKLMWNKSTISMNITAMIT